VTEEGADAHIDKLSHKYMGKDYPFRDPNSTRVIYKIAPMRVSASG